jgi:hypothetical protein
MATFSDRAKPLVITAAKIARLQGAESEAIILEKADASLIETGYDNWDGGQSFYTLMLEIPIPIYASIDDNREALEKSIHQRVKALIRTESGNLITEVVISPVLADDARPLETDTSTTPEDLPSFWQPGFFRLFIGHIAAHKDSAHRLKEALARYQVAAFVAHDDIEPTREWQAEIERALRTMDSLVALVTPGFVESRWCDQEVGIALGRGKLVVPLCAGADPHGFLSKHQGLQTKGMDAARVAEKVVEILIQHSLSAQRMSEALVERIVKSWSWDQSKQTMSMLEKVPKLNSSQVGRLMSAIDENSQIGDAYGVPDRIKNLVKRVGENI